MNYMIWVWLGIIVFSLIAEFISVSMTSLWFAFGGLVSLILASTGKVDILWQVIVFVLVSLAFLISLRKLALKFLFKKDEKTNVDALAGKEFFLLTEINEQNAGTLKMDGVVWSCISVNEKETIPEGTKVQIVEVKGNKLVVKKVEEEK